MKRSALLFFIVLIFSGISYGLINSSINGLKLNDMLLEDKGIYVYGDFSSVASNDFAKVPTGYYSLNGFLGEYRYHGFDFSFNPFSNNDFPNDANTNIALENKKWIVEGWKLKGYTSNVFYDYCLNGEEKLATFLKGAYEQMLPFKVSKNNDTYKYLYISQFPTITTFGEGMMVHETENGIWYQTFSLDILNHKLPTDVSIDINSVKEEDFDLIKLNKKIDVKVTGILEDTNIVNDIVLRSIFYNRKDIDIFVFNVNGKEIKTVPNYTYNESKVESTIYLSQIDFERGYIDVDVSFHVVYKNGDVSASKSVSKRYSFDTNNTLFSYFNTGNFLVDGEVERSDIVYFNLSKGKIDEYEIKFEYKGIEKVYFLYSLNINESVKEYLFDFIEQNEIPLYSPITISQIARNDFSESEYIDAVMMVSKDTAINMDFTIPSEIFDVEHIGVVNNTNMTKVKSSKVFVNNQEVDFKYFISGNYFYGMIDKDILVNVEIEMISFSNVKYSYKTWLLVKTTIPFIDFKQDSIAREKESILFINNESLVNSSEKLSKYPIDYSVKSKDGMYSFENKDLILIYNTPGVYRITICAANAFRKAYKDYRVIVGENLPPTVNFHIYDNQIYRGELLEYYIEVISPDGDEIIDEELILYKDLNIDGIYESSEVFNPNNIFSEMGNYKLVAKASERLKSVTVEREFTVGNHMPLTTLSLDSTKHPEKVDLLIVAEEEIVMEDVANNILLYEDKLSEKGYDARVEYFFNNSINYSLDVNEVVNTGSAYPSSYINYSNDGYEGILYLYATQDIGYYVDYGYYTTKTTCRDIPIYGKIRSCSICGTYINPLGFKMCKFCYTVIGTTRQCTTRRYWVSNLVWVPSYRGYYSGTVYKKVINVYEDRYREDANKYLFYIDGDMEDMSVWSNKTENMYLIEGNSVSEKIDEIFESSLVYPNTFLVDEVFNLEYGNFDFENDPIIKEEFITIHNNLFFDHPMDLYERNNVWISSKPNVYANAGFYEIKRRIFDYTSPSEFSKQSNEPNVYLKIHRVPISSFYINIYPKLELVDNSYDPDYHYQREDRGIVETKVIIEDESFNKIYGLPDELLPGKYKVSYYVKDVDGAWGVSQKNIVVDYNSPYVIGSVNPKVVSIDDVITIGDIYVYSSGSTNLKISLYNDDGFVQDISDETFLGSLSGIGISNKDFIIPRSFEDGVYYFVFYINGSEKLFKKFDVFSPICLNVTSIGKVKRDSTIIIEATVKDYVDDLFIIVDGRYHEMVKEGDRWLYETMAYTEDMFVRASLNSKFEMQKVDIQIVDEFITDFYMIGDWSYWRGQLNMFSNRVSYNQLRFMSLEHVTVVVEVLGEIDEIVLDSSDNLKDVKFNNYHNFSELNLTFPVIVKRSVSNKFVYDFILPIVSSSLDNGNVRVGAPYYLTVIYGDVERSISFDITGNIYDRVFIQPMY